MPPFITALIPTVVGLVKNLFATASDNKRKVEEAKAKADEARANAERAASEAEVSDDSKNASLAQSNKHIYVMIVLGSLIGVLIFAGIEPEMAEKVIQNIEKVFSPAALDKILTLVEDLVRALAGVTQES